MRAWTLPVTSPSPLRLVAVLERRVVVERVVVVDSHQHGIPASQPPRSLTPHTAPAPSSHTRRSRTPASQPSLSLTSRALFTPYSASWSRFIVATAPLSIACVTAIDHTYRAELRLRPEERAVVVALQRQRPQQVSRGHVELRERGREDVRRGEASGSAPAARRNRPHDASSR